MQDVLDKLSEAHAEISKIDTKSREVLADVLLRETRVAKREKDADEKDAIISSREEAVSKIESIVALKKEAEYLFTDALELMDKVKNAQKELEQNTKASNDKLSDLREIAYREQENVDKQKKDIENEIGSRVNQCLVNMGIKKA